MKRWVVLVVCLGLAIAGVDLYLKSHISSVVHNSGSFLGLALPNSFLLIAHVSIFLVGSYFVLSKMKSAFWRAWVLIVLLSSLSNLVERLVGGSVTDYLQLFGIWFNLADLTVTLALVVALYAIMRQQHV